MSPWETLTDLEKAYVRAENAGNGPEADRLRRLIDDGETAKEYHLTEPVAKLNAAIWYARTLGVPVFPCWPGQKQPATRNGYLDATRDLAVIRQWWGTMPDANVAYPTGVMFDVIDVDGPAGVASVGQLRADGHLPAVIARANTPRGFHYYIAPTGDGNTTALRPGIDYRGQGGYVLAPPSWFAGTPAGPRSEAKPAGPYRWTEPLTAAAMNKGLI